MFDTINSKDQNLFFLHISDIVHFRNKRKTSPGVSADGTIWTGHNMLFTIFTVYLSRRVSV